MSLSRKRGHLAWAALGSIIWAENGRRLGRNYDRNGPKMRNGNNTGMGLADLLEAKRFVSRSVA